MITNRGKNNRAAFVRGLIRGLSGTVSMYEAPERPAPAKVHVTVSLHRYKVGSMDAMASDWVQTGADIDAAIKKLKKNKNSHGKDRRAPGYSPA